MSHREKQAAKEQAESDRWEPYWTASGGPASGPAEANALAVEELQNVVKRLSRRVTDLEEEVSELRRRPVRVTVTVHGEREELEQALEELCDEMQEQMESAE